MYATKIKLKTFLLFLLLLCGREVVPVTERLTRQLQGIEPRPC